MANLIPYLTCDNSLNTLEHYKTIFGEDILVGRAPLNEEMAQNMNYEGDISKATMHMVMNIEGNLMMASDNFSNDPLYPQNLMIDYNSDSEEDIKRIKEIAKNFEDNSDCETLMPLAEQFWGGMMGQYKDKFGNTFMLHAQSFEAQRKQGGILEEIYK